MKIELELKKSFMKIVIWELEVRIKIKRLGVAFKAEDKSTWNNIEWNKCDES